MRVREGERELERERERENEREREREREREGERERERSENGSCRSGKDCRKQMDGDFEGTNFKPGPTQ